MYDIVLGLAVRLVAWLAAHKSMKIYKSLGLKTRLFMDGQSVVMEQLAKEFRSEGKDVYWFHCASLGEYGIARPLLKCLHTECDCRIVLTFFSSTGVEALKKRDADYTGADFIGYLPLDSRGNVKRFLDLITPKKVVFVKSEIWVNYLGELKRRGIPTYLTSALIKENAVYGRWYGGLFKRALFSFSEIFTQDDDSVKRLEALGYKNARNTGDTLYDNAIAIARTPYHNVIIERFCKSASKGVFIAGSIDLKYDLPMVAHLIEKHPDVKFIVVPHETNEKYLSAVMSKMATGQDTHAPESVVRYTQCDENTDFAGVRVMVIDFVGELSRMYRYCKWTYVGGGFTPLLHSVIEPSVYGLPVAFGPCIDRKAAPLCMIKVGIGEVVRNADELDHWFCGLKDDDAKMRRIHDEALRFAKENEGATEKVVERLLNKGCSN